MNSYNKVPGHVAFIMDGNRRWSRERNLSTIEGHKAGYDKMKAVPDWVFERGAKIVSFYAFSTENWSRSREEVNYLMKLLQAALTGGLDDFRSRGYRLLISGKIEDLPGDLPEACLEAMNKTKNNKRGVVNVCVNYGGREEIVDAVKKMIKNNVSEEQVHVGLIRKYLYQSEIPDPDIIIRTSGEKRLSGFQLWQSAYSELMFMEKYWPEIEERDIETILKEYSERNRRFGGS